VKKYIVEAIVLKNSNFKDADKLFTLLSKESGLISVQAKGVRKITSKRAGNLDTLNHVKAKISEQPSGWKLVDEVVLIESFRPIKDSLLAQSYAFYLLELAYRLIKDEGSMGQLFDRMVLALHKISSSKSELESFLIINSFEVFLLRFLGYQVELTSCVQCDREFNSDWSGCKLSFTQGGFVCDRCFGLVQGVLVEMKTAEVLHSINSNFVYKPMGLTREHVYAADDILKLYVKNVLEDGFKTERVFKSIKEL
jgi:DNA repair protein RecO (recombination protein O)